MYKILIVDDEKEIVDGLRRFLDRQGFETHVAFDGEEAKEQIKLIHPDAVLLDLIMPKANGFEVLLWIRENIHKRIPVIILSIKDTLEDVKRGYNFDADLYLPKPSTHQDLLRGVQTVLSLTFKEE